MRLQHIMAKTLASFVFMLLLVPIASYAIDSDCGLGLLASGGSAPTIDGDPGTEWAGASVLNSSTSPCLDDLLDLQGDPNVGPYVWRSVEVRSQRYNRGTVPYVGFLFTVPDSTPCTGNPSDCAGEMLVIHFNPLINGDTELDTAAPDLDRRIELKHFWEASTGPVPGINGRLYTQPAVSSPSFCSSAANPLHNGTRFGSDDGSLGINFGIRQSSIGNTYIVEIEVPESYINPTGTMTLTEDIGVAFGIINDFATTSGLTLSSDTSACSSASPCSASGTGFPDSLQVVNGFQPTGTCQPGWTEPRKWGVGYLNNPPDQISISRSPSFWSSNGIRVKECNSLGYTYYPSNPCRALIEADIVNTGAVQTKKVLFIWSPHGTGIPANYEFIEIQDVVIASNDTTTVESSLWAGMPTGQANHPCLRVYILPDDFDENLTAGVTEQDLNHPVNGIVARYNVQQHHWAQKNISRHSTITQCPDANCRVVNIDSPFRFDLSLFPSAFAQDASNFNTGKKKPSKKLSKKPYAIDPDLAALTKGNVLVMVNTLAQRILPGVKSKYNFVEDFGGVIQAFPIEMVQKNAILELEFEMPNAADYEVEVLINTQVYSPNTDLDIELNLEPKTLTLQAGSERTITGQIVNHDLPVHDSRCRWSAPFNILCGLSTPDIFVVLAIVLILLILAIFKKLFRRKNTLR